MNFLAHIALAGGDGALEAGAVLGDFIKGPLHGARPAAVEDGIRLHRRIDAASARLADLQASAARFPPPLRRFAPVFIDVLADHFLAGEFTRWHLLRTAVPVHGDVRDFAAGACRRIAPWLECFPDDARQFFERMREHDLLSRYREPATLQRVNARICARLHGRVDPDAVNAAITAGRAALYADFTHWYPRIVAIAAEWRAVHVHRLAAAPHAPADPHIDPSPTASTGGDHGPERRH